jgi:hypothetical protein
VHQTRTHENISKAEPQERRQPGCADWKGTVVANDARRDTPVMVYRCRAQTSDGTLCRNRVRVADTRCHLHQGRPGGRVPTPPSPTAVCTGTAQRGSSYAAHRSRRRSVGPGAHYGQIESGSTPDAGSRLLPGHPERRRSLHDRGPGFGVRHRQNLGRSGRTAPQEGLR